MKNSRRHLSYGPSYGLSFARCAGLLVAGAMLGACAITDDTHSPGTMLGSGERLAGPVTRQLAWFAHVESRDLLDQCGDGQERYRLIYNGRYEEQIRSYTLAPAGNDAWQIDAFVRDEVNLVDVVLSPDDPLAPLRGVTRQSTHAADAMQPLLTAIRGLPPVQVQTNLNGAAFYWLIVGCRSGVPVYFAAQYDGAGPDLRALPFRAPLQALDPLPVAVNEPRTIYGQRAPDALFDFVVTVGPSGLTPLPKLLK